MPPKIRIYKTSIQIPKGNDREFFAPSGMSRWEGMNGRDLKVYMSLCMLDGVATARQINSILFHFSIRTISPFQL